MCQTSKFLKFIFKLLGPTNSGKTYEALKRFREAKTGFYCGPLRLLATEIYMKMNDDGMNIFIAKRFPFQISVKYMLI